MNTDVMDRFQNLCKTKLVNWYERNRPDVKITVEDTFIVWSCKTLQNCKCLVSTGIKNEHIYAEYTLNGDKKELYEDVYDKITHISTYL